MGLVGTYGLYTPPPPQCKSSSDAPDRILILEYKKKNSDRYS